MTQQKALLSSQMVKGDDLFVVVKAMMTRRLCRRDARQVSGLAEGLR
jgi:hypothetical protein